MCSPLRGPRGIVGSEVVGGLVRNLPFHLGGQLGLGMKTEGFSSLIFVSIIFCGNGTRFETGVRNGFRICEHTKINQYRRKIYMNE